MRKPCMKRGRHAGSGSAVAIATPRPVPPRVRSTRWGTFRRRDTKARPFLRRTTNLITTEMVIDSAVPARNPATAYATRVSSSMASA